jgi:DNA-directed RNA polymerase sigma subunit (sigma70/sigma32)
MMELPEWGQTNRALSFFTERVLANAARFSRMREDPYVGSAHLLAGILDEPDCVGYRALEEAGADLTSLRVAVGNALAERLEYEGSAAREISRAEEAPVLSRDEERELCAAASAGAEVFRKHLGENNARLRAPDPAEVEVLERGSRAIGQLLAAHRRTAVTVAQEYARAGHDFLYVYNEGVTGLAMAVVTPRWTFEWREHERFEGYAREAVRAAIDAALQRRGAG